MKKFFTMIGAALILGSLSGQADNVEVWVSYHDLNTDEWGTVKSFETEIVKNDDGSYTLQNFFNSGYPASFTFEHPEINEYNPLQMCSNIFRNPLDSHTYLMKSETYEVDEDGWPDGDDYIICYAYDFEGSYVALWYPFIDDAGDPVYSSFVSHLDPEEEEYDYYASIVLSATYHDASDTPQYYLNFMFNDPNPSAVKSLDAAIDGSVEYYNLNGMRVENPSNGIFIRKQGNLMKKVIIR